MGSTWNRSDGSSWTATGPLEWLVEGHAQLRLLCDLAVELACNADAPPDDLAKIAGRLHRDFVRVFALYTADEDDSVAPRLEPLLSASLLDELQVLKLEHAELTARLEWLKPHWEVLSLSLDDARTVVPDLVRPSQTLRALLLSHLEREEAHVLPAVDEMLRAEDRAAILSEMRSRRGLA